jgi:organic hydroperoxide reductase OsmC/OhrA
MALSTLDRLWDQILVSTLQALAAPARPTQVAAQHEELLGAIADVASPMPAGSPTSTPSTPAPAPIREADRHGQSAHHDTVVTWTGNRGTGTSGYRHYDRAHEVTADGPATILGSSDPAFRGDPARWNPEQLLVAALSQCHMLQYLHQCADAEVVVTGYVDHAHGTMAETGEGGRFTEVVLRPHVSVASPAMVDIAMALHAAAHRACFIASSVNFPVHHEPHVQAVAA